ncbi:MAG: Armadillo repeat-containing protein 8 [Peltula sp. TS41687]|nr:MAG: Armadillo repeat-containing protein 8 [Peltula sp. TS41687]
MARPSTPPILTRLCTAASTNAQAAALRELKHEIIGTEQKKVAWIKLGLVPHLLQVLSAESTSKRSNPAAHAYRDDGSVSKDDTEDARLQATIIVGSLAHGGPAFVAPLLSVPIISALSTSLDPSTVSSRLLLETLRTLTIIAESLALTSPGSGLHQGALSDVLFSNAHVDRLRQILSQTSSKTIVQQQISLTSRLIAKLCRDERHRTSLSNSGVLEALGSRMAGFVVAMGYVLPEADHIARTSGNGRIPRPAPQSAELYPILEAVSSIIHDSKYRALQLFYSRDLMAVFPPSAVNSVRSRGSGPADGPEQSSTVNPLDSLLPPIPTAHHKSVSSRSTSFPSISAARDSSRGPSTKSRSSTGSPWSYDPHSYTVETSQHPIEADRPADDECPVVAWLICLIRSEYGLIRLMAASVLAELVRTGLVSKRRETLLAYGVIPILVSMLGEPAPLLKASHRYSPTNAAHWLDYKWAKERAPAIMAMLVTDCVELQKAAVDGKAIKKLAEMLKSTYEPIPERKQASAWTPMSETGSHPGDNQASSARRLGDPGLRAQLMHNLRVRESTLQGLASLAPFIDEYRKKIIDSGVTSFLLQSLKSWEDSSSGPATNGHASGDDAGHLTAPKGNPASVIVAACDLARTLSRSVSILRTSLIDSGVASPLFLLLRSSDIEVQIAATAALCNLILEFSPMREAIMQAGAMKVLCEHTQSPNPRLRLNATWALKHLVFFASQEVKFACLEELGQGGLLQLICGDSEETSSTGDSGNNVDDPMDMSGDIDNHKGGGAGEPAESIPDESWEPPILEREDTNGDEDREMKLDEPTSNAKDNNGSPHNQSHKSGTPHQQPNNKPFSPTTINAQLMALRDTELNPAKQSQRDALAIQEQGLDFIRNLINGPKSDEIIDKLITYFNGPDQLFAVLSSKLRRPSPSPGPITLQKPQPQLMWGSSETLTATLFILVHIAASAPRHRALLTAQTQLLKQLLPLFQHPSKNVRAPLVWLVINITWVDDQTDEAAAKARAAELKRLGYQPELEALLHDPELDVRERARTGLYQLR